MKWANEDELLREEEKEEVRLLREDAIPIRKSEGRHNSQRGQMKAITSLKKAQALPGKDRISYRDTRQTDGTILRTPYFRETGVVDLNKKAIWLFADTDGRIMQIGYDVEGAYKYESYL